MTIGQRIKSRREYLKLSQEELAIKCGYKSRSSIQKIETARDLPLKKISKMAQALEVSESYLMGWTDDEEPRNDNAEMMEQLYDAYSTGRVLGKISKNPTLLEEIEKLMSLSDDMQKFIFNQIDFLYSQLPVEQNQE